MKSTVPVQHDSKVFNIKTDIASINLLGLSDASHIEINHPTAGWVICSSEPITVVNKNTPVFIETTTFLNINKKFMGNGTGHEMFFEGQEDAIRHIIANSLRNCWAVFKVS